MFREQFHQQRVRFAPVQNHHRLDTVIERIDGGFKFWNHAARGGAVGNERTRFVARHLPDQLSIGIQHAVHIREQQKALGVQGPGDCACGGVGDFSDFRAAIDDGHASAVAAGNIFHFTEHSYKRAKKHLKDRGYDVRYPYAS